jgi:hypothetical protein
MPHQSDKSDVELGRFTTAPPAAAPRAAPSIYSRTPLLPLEAVEEFRELYEKTYGTSLTAAQAVEIAQRLARLYALLLTPLEDIPKKHDS